MTGAITVDSYIRTFDELRPQISVDLPAGDPLFVRPLAGVTLHARVQRREVREESMELSQAVVKVMQRGMPPVPEQFATMSRTVLGTIDKTVPCTLCGVRPGFGPCPRCVGTGVIAARGGMVDCPDCEEGWTTCTTCDGVRQVVIAKVRHVDDHDVEIRHTFLPLTTSRLEESLLDAFVADEPDECLRFDLDLRSNNAPYRSAGDDVVRDNAFLGYRFAESIDRARKAVARLGGTGEWVREEVHAFARPFLWVAWGDEDPPVERNVAFVVTPRTTSVLLGY